MERKESWPEELATFIAQCETDKDTFEWGSVDCLHFVTEAISRMTGLDIKAQFYPKGLAYGTEGEAVDIMKRDFKGGLNEVCEIAARYNDMEEITPPYARRGDAVLIDTPFGDILGICMGARFVGIGYDGLVYFPLTSIKRAWRV